MIGGLIWIGVVVGGCWWAWRKWGRPAIVTGATAEPETGRWNFHLLRPRLPKEPSADDILVANAPQPVDPIGYVKAKTIREMVKNITPEDKNWTAVEPSVSPVCLLCNGTRVPRSGVLVCETCDHLEDRKELTSA